MTIVKCRYCRHYFPDGGWEVDHRGRCAVCKDTGHEYLDKSELSDYIEEQLAYADDEPPDPFLLWCSMWGLIGFLMPDE